MSTFDDDERAVSASRPIDLYTITTPTAVYRITSHAVDVTYAGDVYTATTMSRGNLQVSQDLTGRELIVYLPIDHPLVQRFASTGIPEHGVAVTLFRMQPVSGQALQQWSGFAQGLSIDGHTAMIRCPSLTDDAMKIRLPTIRAQKICNHVLYDALCTIDRSLFTVIATLVSQTDVTLLLSNMAGKPDQWAQYGEVAHAASGQRRMVIEQIGAVLTLNAPFVGVLSGENLTIYAGCAHDVTTCRDKFANVINFGGMPQMNGATNAWSIGGIGIIRQV